MTATKIQPGDDTHLTSLMAPHSLNFVTGADRAALLAYGRDVFAAARGSKCLAQIEEPAQPGAEICSASHDDAEFGERAIKPLCDISSFEYGTPLYAGAAPAAVAPQGERQWICPTRTVADLANNLLTMDQALPIYGAQYIEKDGRRCAIAVPPTVSRERVQDGRWIGQGEELNAAVVWTRAEQPTAVAGPALDVTLDEEQAGLLRDMLGDPAEYEEALTVRLIVCDGHSGHGLYVAQAEYQDEGAALLAPLPAPAAPALEAPGAREVTVERYEIPGGMRSALEDVISYLRSHGRRDLVRLMQELYTAISPWDGGSCSDVPDALVPARPDAEYLLSIARNNRWPMLMRAHIKSAALATAPALEAPAAPVGSARQFIEWMYSQPEDREPTTAEGALLEFEAHLAAAAPQAPAAPADAQAFAEWWDRERGTARNRLPGDDWMDLSNDDREQYEAAFNAGMRAAQAAPAAPAVDALGERDAAFEAVRKRLCGLQRYSFVLDDDGVVRRAQDRTGNWIEFDDAHALFDPVAVDAARAAQAKEGGEA